MNLSPFAYFLVALVAAVSTPVLAQDARYLTRASDCRLQVPPGVPLAVTRLDSGIRANGYVADRVASYTADASSLAGGELSVCSEYGRVEFVDSDDDKVRVQVRWDGFGEGADDPAAAARRVIEETDVQVHLTAHDGRLFVRVWHPMLGFTVGGQPAWVSVRVQVPNRGAWRVVTEAFHGVVSVRRLTLTSATLSGRVGEKLKGIDGFNAGTELYDVTLAGDVEIANPMSEHGAPVLARVRVAANSRLTVHTGGEVRIAVQPHPLLAVRAFAGATTGTARVGIDRGVPGLVLERKYPNQSQVESPDYERAALRIDVHAVSGGRNVQIVSVPSASLARPR